MMNPLYAGTCASPPQHDATYSTAMQTGRGNVTSVQQWLNTGGTITSHKTYDIAGNVYTDPKGYQTRTTYESTCTFPTTITNPLSQSTMMSWDIYLGKPSSMTDPNQFTTQWSYNDPFLLDRLTKVTRAGKVQSSYFYDETMGANKLTTYRVRWYSWDGCAEPRPLGTRYRRTRDREGFHVPVTRSLIS